MVALLVLAWLGLACIPGSIAESKGRPFFGYWLFGLFFFLPALIVALLQPSLESRRAASARSCPHCLSAIPAAASVCAHCRRDVPPMSTATRSRAHAAVSADLSDIFSAGELECRTPDCDAAGMRTTSTRCSVCGESTAPRGASGSSQPQPGLRLAPVSSQAVGVCNNSHCQAAGLPTKRRWCDICGSAIAQPIG
jgi:hypothetical protein